MHEPKPTAPRARLTKLWSIDALAMETSTYSVLVALDVGGNPVELRHLPSCSSLLRMPGSEGEYRASPQLFGSALLFPPNRVRHGKFSFNGIDYEFPRNEDAILRNGKRHHLHGFLREMPFSLEEVVCDEASVTAVVSARFSPEAGLIPEYPHAFEVVQRLRLSDAGFEQRIEVSNHSEALMPLGLGLHTCLNFPFSLHGERSACVWSTSLGDRWELDGDNIPTGRKLDCSCEGDPLRERFRPAGQKVLVHGSACPLQQGETAFHGSLLTDESLGHTVRMEVSPEFGHWLLWTRSADETFLCAEPQTWMTNAPNVMLPTDVTGFRALAPGERFTAWIRLSLVVEQED